MKAIIQASFVAALSLTAVSGSFAQSAQATASASDSMSSGEIKKVDKSTGKLTIKHGPLKNLGMDAMTMVFKAQSPAMLNEVKVGDKVNFVAEDVKGQLTVTKIEKQQ